MAKNTILVITRQSPLDVVGGSGAYAYDVLSFLARAGYTVHCVVTNPNFAGERGFYSVPKEVSGKFRLHIEKYWSFHRFLLRPDVIPRRLLRAAMRLLSRLLFLNRLVSLVKVARERSAGREDGGWRAVPASRGEIVTAERYFRKLKPQAVLANYCWMAPALPKAANGCAKLVLTHDVWHQKAEAFTQAGVTSRSSFSIDAERELLSMADAILAISEEDADTFRRMLPEKKIIIVPKAAHTKEARNLPERGRCLFVGSGSEGNRNGIRWFLNEVWPLVLSRISDASLDICGGVCAHLKNEPLDNVRLVHFVSDLEPYYTSAELVVVPLLVGSGMKLKLVEALSFGCACVSTKVGLQGLNFLLEAKGVRRADTPAEFCGEIVHFMTHPDERSQMAKNGFAAVKDRLSPARCYGPLRAFLDSRTRNG